MENQLIITISTDPSTGRGGVSHSVRYLTAAINENNGICKSLVTHDHTPFFGKWRPFLMTIISMTRLILTYRLNSGRPIVWAHVGGPVSLGRKFILVSFARLLGAKVIIHLHSASTDRFLDGGIRQSMFEFLLGPAHKVVVVSDWWRSRLLDFGISKPIYVCTNCIEDLTVSESVDNLTHFEKCNSSSVRILAMSRMVEGKGFDLILEGVALCSGNYAILMAGDGDLRLELEKQVTKLGLEDRVKFVGWLDDTRKNELLRSVDIFCLPSQNDSFGMVYIEAMRAGLPIIAYDYPPVRSVIGEQAALYVKTPDELSVALEDLASNHEKRRTLAAAGVERVADCYSMQNVKIQIANILKEFNDS